MNKTIKEIADELGINKQRVYRYIERTNIKEVTTDKNAKYYDDAAQKIIIDHFGDASDNGSNVDEKTTEIINLKEDIIKRQDDEINRLAKQVESLQSIIDTQAKQFDQQQQLELESIRTFKDNTLISSDASKGTKKHHSDDAADTSTKDTKSSKSGLNWHFWRSNK